MDTSEKKYFDLLRDAISRTLREKHGGIAEDIRQWKGQDIIFFQEDLEHSQKGRISEKWFYTHIKGNNDKLPRIDMLNLLSRYVGCTDWSDFIYKNTTKVPAEQPAVKKPKPIPSSQKVNVSIPRKGYEIKPMLYAIILMGIVAILGVIFYPQTNTYSFCFIDSDLRTSINHPVEVFVDRPNDNPLRILCDSNACFHYETKASNIRFIVKAPYYRTDTVIRISNRAKSSEEVYLKSNDYALMLHYFSTSKVKDWKKRRSQMDEMFAENAQIYQILGARKIGVELYNKHEFINKMTLPTKSLSNIEIIETTFSNGKISRLRFRQKDE